MSYHKLKKNASFNSTRNNGAYAAEKNDAMRYINNNYNANINRFCKMNKNCFGNVEQYYLSKFVKQDQSAKDQHKQKLFLEFLEKTSKQMLVKNSVIFKSRRQYETQYQEFLLSQKPTHSVNYLNDYLKKLQPQVFQQQIIQKDIRKTIRPMTPSITRFRNRFNSYQAKFSSTALQSNCFIESQRLPQHFSAKNFYQRNNSFMFSYRPRMKSQVVQESSINMCSQRGGKIPAKQNICKSCITSTNNKKQTSKIKEDKINLQENQKLQIKNKILMLNSGLAINLIKPQGYKPKRQSWNKYYM